MADYNRCHVGGGGQWNTESIPTELKEQDQWLIAKITESGKPPLYPKSPTDVDRGLSFDDVVRVVEDPDLGFINTNRVSEDDQIVVGFMLAPNDDYFFLDWDDVRDPNIGDESIPQSVIRWVKEIGGYTEVSPSGTGLKTICRSESETQSVIDLNSAGKIFLDHPPVGMLENKPHIDVYLGGQYTTVTGNVLTNLRDNDESKELSDGGSALSNIAKETLSSPTSGLYKSSKTSSGEKSSLANIGAQSVRQWQSRNNKNVDDSSNSTVGKWIETDDPTIEQIRATGFENEDEFSRLWRGNISKYSTVSEADHALVSRLWYYADNQSLVDQAFRASNLYRIRIRRPSLSDWDKSYPKWDQDTYRRSTLKSASDNDRHKGHYLDPSN